MPGEQQPRLSRSQRRRLRTEGAGEAGDQRRPHWGCSACGEHSNWACRPFCRGCGAPGPQHHGGGRRSEVQSAGPGGGRATGAGGAGQPPPSGGQAVWPRPGEASDQSTKAAPRAAPWRRQWDKSARASRNRSSPPRGQGSQELGATQKPKPAVKSFAAVVGQWRPEVLAAAQDPEERDVDEDLEAVAAVELLTVEEQQRLRLRYLRERPSEPGRSAGRTWPPATRRSSACPTRPGSSGRGRFALRLRRMRSGQHRRSGTACGRTWRRQRRRSRPLRRSWPRPRQTGRVHRQAWVRVKAEVRQGAEPQPGISQQDEEVLGALRGMVASTGLPVQNLLTALYTVPLGRRWARPEAAAWVAPPLRGLRRLAPEMQSTRPRRLPPCRGALPHSPSRLVTAWRSRASQRLRRRPRLPRASRWHRRSRCRAAPQKSKSKRRRLPGRGRDNEGCRRQSCEALLVWCGGLVPEGQLPNGARGC